MFMFVGCEFVTPLAPEMKAPGKTIPRAMALGLVGVAICMFLYGAAIRQVANVPVSADGPHAPARHAGCDSRVRAAGARAVRPHLVRHRVPAPAPRRSTADGRLPRILYGMAIGALRALLPTSALQDAGGRYRRRGDRADLSCVADQRQSRQHPAPCARRHLRVGHAYLLVTASVVMLRIRRRTCRARTVRRCSLLRCPCRHHPGDLVHHAAGHERARHLRAVRRDAEHRARCSGRSSCSVGIRSSRCRSRKCCATSIAS